MNETREARILPLFAPRAPTAQEAMMFAAFAAEANALGALLRRTYCIDVQGGHAIDLSDCTER